MRHRLCFFVDFTDFTCFTLNISDWLKSRTIQCLPASPASLTTSLVREGQGCQIWHPNLVKLARNGKIFDFLRSFSEHFDSSCGFTSTFLYGACVLKLLAPLLNTFQSERFSSILSAESLLEFYNSLDLIKIVLRKTPFVLKCHFVWKIGVHVHDKGQLVHTIRNLKCSPFIWYDLWRRKRWYSFHKHVNLGQLFK